MKGITKILFGKAMGIVLAAAMIASVAVPMGADAAGSSTATVEDTTNTFVGTINGEEVVGYLEDTDLGYRSGLTYESKYLMFDGSGVPRYKVYIEIDKNLETGTYSSEGEYDRDKVYVTVYAKWKEESAKWEDYYTFRDSDKAWSFSLTGADYSDNGVFTGSVSGLCMPGPYSGDASDAQLEISGSFNFQMQAVHPTVEAYKAEHPDKARNYGSSSTGSSSGSDKSTSSDSGKSAVDHTCRTCGGTGSCKKCYGSGSTINPYNGKVRDCVRCRGTGDCAVCYGTGKVY